MKNVARILLLTMLALMIIACSGDSDDDAATEEAAIENEAATVIEVPETTDEPQSSIAVDAQPETVTQPEAEPVVEAVDLPAWQTMQLTDARTGETFTLADFAGKTVFVEPMATWCTNCRAQLNRVAQARPQLDSDQFVFIGLSLETDLADDRLASYADEQGFDWTFAVMPIDLLSALSDEFGRGVRSAPNTPHFVIRPDGTFTELTTGATSADDIVTWLQTENEI